MTQPTDFAFPLSGPAPAMPAAPASPSAHAPAYPGERDCIIVADDSELSRSIIRRILFQHFDLLEARNGAEIVQYLRNPPKSIAAVLCDIMMPVMDGFQVLDFMQKNGLLNVFPVVVATALADAKSKIQCYEAGAFDVLDKPFDSAFLPYKLRLDIDRFRHIHTLSSNPVAQAHADQLEALLSALPAAIYVEDPASGIILHGNDLFRQIPGVPANPVGQSFDTFPVHPELLAGVRSAREAILSHNIAKPVLINGSAPGSIYSIRYGTFPNPVSSVTQLVGFITNVTYEIRNRGALENRIRPPDPRYP